MSTKQQYNYALPIGYKLQGGENVYVIEEVLGKGGFGITYKVKARISYKKMHADAHFALKEFFPSQCWRDEDNATLMVPPTQQDELAIGIKEFTNEARRLQQVSEKNPNIVKVDEVFEANDTAYYVLEYLDGGDLRKMVKKNGGPLSERQMLDVMLPIGRALQCLHENKILHLDIKPDNIMMSLENDTPAPKLIDFGLATHYATDGTPTSQRPLQGYTEGYAPFEQYSPITSFDPRIDIYAFSATCLYLLTGKDPVKATTLIQQPAGYVRSLIPTTVSDRVASAIVSGMGSFSKDRPQSMTAMLALLTEETPVNRNQEKDPPKSSPKPKPGETVNLHPRNDAPKPARERAVKAGLSGSTSKPSLLKRKMPIIALTVILAVVMIAGVVVISKRCSSSDKSGIINNPAEQTFTVDGVSFTMVAVEGGAFTMGATSEQGSDAEDNEKPAHSVTLSTYYIGQTEVTQALWEAVMGENPSWFNGYGNSKYGSNHSENYGTNLNRPVERVSWDDCQEFIRKLNAKTGKNFRLPTEAEWEYAARGGNKSKGYKYSGSNTIGDVAWYYENSGNKTHDIATKRANELGIYDMSGNVWEWCSDWYGDYSSASQTNPTGPASGSFRVCRGGGWNVDAWFCRVSLRDGDSADSRCNDLGFRLAL